jgi:hypothetical protein
MSRGRPGVLEGMLATALRCCGSRELQISDSGVRRACSDDPRVRAFAAA